MAAVNTSGWVYGNWQEAATPALRLASLVQHITEVRNAVIESTQTEGRSQRMNIKYLELLRQDEKDLRFQVGMSASESAASAPIVAQPRF